MRRVVLALAALLVSAASAAAGGSASFPKRIALRRLPAGGNRDRGRAVLRRVDPDRRRVSREPADREGRRLVRPRQGRAAIGIEADRGRLFVAGGSTGKAFVYDARTGASLAALQLAAGGRRHLRQRRRSDEACAWFTDSSRDVLYRVPLSASGRPGAQSTVKALQIKGDFQFEAGSTRTASTRPSTERGS